MKNSFVFYTEYRKQIELLNDEQAGVLLKSILQYADGEEPEEMDDVTAMAFSFIQSQMDRDSEKYDAICEKRREAGNKGGRPQKAKKPNGFSEKTKKPNGFFEKQTKAKKPDNEYEYEYENENEDDLKESTLKGAKEKRFTPPTIEEVRSYCRERKNDVDPEKFVDFYESKGWMIGKNKMKSWKAALRTWEKPRDGPAPKSEPNSFHNFDEHGYNYDDLEEKLQKRRNPNGKEDDSTR